MTIKARARQAPSQRPIKLPGKEVGINHFLPPLEKGFQAPPNDRREGSLEGVGSLKILHLYTREQDQPWAFSHGFDFHRRGFVVPASPQQLCEAHSSQARLLPPLGTGLDSVQGGTERA